MSFFASGTVPITALSFLYNEGRLEPVFIMAKSQAEKGLERIFLMNAFTIKKVWEIRF